MTRVRFILFWTSDGHVVEIQTRKEHVDPPLQWSTVWKTEPYRGHERQAIKRAKLWVSQNLPGAIA